MRQKIRIPCDVLEILRTLGDISTVADTALGYAFGGGCDLMSCPRIDHGRPTQATTVHISNHEYLDYITALGVHSNRVSLARLLTWLVDSGTYEQIPWDASPTPTTTSLQTRYTDMAYQRSIEALLRLHSLEHNRGHKQSVYNIIQQLRETYENIKETTDGLQDRDNKT